LKPEEFDEINRRGRAAEQLLGSDTLRSVFNELLERDTKRWIATNEREIREREECHMRIRAVQAIFDELNGRIDAMVKANREAERKEQLRKVI